MTIKTIFIKILEFFKSLGLVSQIGITLGFSMAMLAGVYVLSQEMSPLPKVTQVVEVQTTDTVSSNSPSKSEKSENKAVAQKESEASTTVSTTELPVTTEEKKVVLEKQEQETEVVVIPNKEPLTTEKVTPQTSETEMSTSIEKPTVKIDEGVSTSTTTTTEEVTTSAHRLLPLGNTNTEFKNYHHAVQYMREKLDETSKAFEQGKQDWVYSGRVYSIPWSDGNITFTVDLIPKVMTPRTPDTSDVSTESNQGIKPRLHFLRFILQSGF